MRALFIRAIVANFVLLLFLLTTSVEANEELREPASRSLKVSKIIVKGQSKIEESAIINKLLTKEGSYYNAKTIRKDIQNVFDLGYFNDITVDLKRSGNKATLTYIVKEKASIASISFSGNDEVDEDDLLEAIDLKEYQILDMAKLLEAQEKLEKVYEDKGFFLANVKYQVKEDEKGILADVIFDIEENEMVRVSEIRFLGNKHLSSTKLKSMMETKEGGFTSSIFGSGEYKQDAFERDIQRLHFIYYNEGYVQAKIDRPQVNISPDKKSIYISIRVEEGARFKVGQVDFGGDLLFTEEELKETISIDEEGFFSSQVLQKDLRALQAKYGDLGYAYANPIPRTAIREKDRVVDITYELEKGNKVYIGKISVKGNTKTRDKVLRREMRILEGELYHETRKRESLANIRRLGFFDEVVFNTSTPDNKPNVMDIDIVVKERNTGQIQLGAGYSSFAGFVINGQIKQTNFLGKGQKLSASLDYSKKQQLFNLNMTEPYFMDTRWSVGGSLYHRERQLTEYKELKTGGSVDIGHPLAPYLHGFIGYKLDDTTLKLGNEDEGTEGDSDLFPVETANGITSAVTTSLVYDKVDDRFAPTNGMFSRLSFEYAGLGGDLKYTKALYTFRYYKKLFWDVVWRNNVNYGFISSNTDKDPPFNQLFLLGGANSLRGYRWFTVGKRKKSATALANAIAAGHSDPESAAMRPFGGTQQFYYNMEFQFPLVDEAGLKGVFFYDIGDADDDLSITDLRSNVGFGFRWYSPIGPLRFEWGFPFSPKEEYDESDTQFHFSIGSPF